MHPRRVLIRICQLVFLIGAPYILGCAHTRIAPRPIALEAQRLLAFAPRNTSIRVSCNLDEIVGHQFLLVVLPFGRISVSDIDELLKISLSTELGQVGISPRFTKGDEPAHYSIDCEGLSLTAYDFIFFRKISSRLTLTLSRGSDIKIPIVSEVSEYRAFAFHPQLERVLHKLFASGSLKVAKEIELAGSLMEY